MTLVEHIATFLTRKGWNPRVIRAGSRFHKFLFRTLRLGRFRLIGQDSLILTTRGRRTGRETSTPLFYAEDGDRLYVASSFAGSGQAPNGYSNLLSYPNVAAETRRSRGRYSARVVDAAEAAALWPSLSCYSLNLADHFTARFETSWCGKSSWGGRRRPIRNRRCELGMGCRR